MIIDCHFHLEPALLSIDEMLRRMDACHIDQTALMAAMGDPLPHTPGALQTILRFCLAHRLFRRIAGVMLTKFSSEGNLKLPTGEFRIYPDPDNEAVFKTVDAYPGRFFGWIFVNPRGERSPLDEYRKWSHHPGFAGVKAHPMWHRYPPSELIPVAEKAAQSGKPLLIHAGFGKHGAIGGLMEKVPGLTLILAHAGFPGFLDTWSGIRNNENIYVDLSQSIYLNERMTGDAAAYLGPERCLFGTDGPYGELDANGLFDYGFLKKRIERMFPDQAVRDLLFYENFLRITGIGQTRASA